MSSVCCIEWASACWWRQKLSLPWSSHLSSRGGPQTWEIRTVCEIVTMTSRDMRGLGCFAIFDRLARKTLLSRRHLSKHLKKSGEAAMQIWG